MTVWFDLNVRVLNRSLHFDPVMCETWQKLDAILKLVTVTVTY